MIFKFILIILVVLILVGIIWYFTRKKYYISFLETSTPTLESYRDPIRTRNHYFPHKDGVLDLSKHPELARFRDLYSNKEYLVEIWKRDKDISLEEGKDKIVLFNFIEKNGITYAIPCLRNLISIVNEPVKDMFNDNMKTSLGVYWNNGEELDLVDDNNLFGVVRYESV